MRAARATGSACLALALAACGGPAGDDAPATPGPTAAATAATITPGPSPSVPSTDPTAGATTAEPTPPREPEVVASGLEVPWALDFLPDGSALVTLRNSAEVLRVRRGEEPVIVGTVPDVDATNEAGLLGISVSPDFATDGHVFVYLTSPRDNRVLRMSLSGDTLTPDEVILDGIPRATYHNGGRIAFGPDGYLYVATGDAAIAGAAQDSQSLAGKILRITPDGEPAPGNPTEGSPVWSLGHRNVQGIGWDDAGRMFASEFGQDTWDELNLIEPGHNYGWPVVEGTGGGEGFTDPLAQWRPADASPSGLAVTDEAVYLAALRGESLWRVPLADDGSVGEPERLLQDEYGRLRAVTVGPDGDLWLLTSNTFRGEPREGDDTIVVIDEDWL